MFRKNNYVLFAEFPQMCVTAIANLIQNNQKENNNKCMFHKDEQIIPFIEQHWESITTMPRRVTQSWHSRVNNNNIILDLSTFNKLYHY